MKEKDLDYFKQNAEEDYMTTPISVLRYINELEQTLEPTLEDTNAKKNWIAETNSSIYDGYRNKITNEWIAESEYFKMFGCY
jgi:hypothetical protein